MSSTKTIPQIGDEIHQRLTTIEHEADRLREALRALGTRPSAAHSVSAVTGKRRYAQGRRAGVRV